MALPPPPAPDSTMPRTEAVQWGGAHGMLARRRTASAR
eukprot:COSAG01_NODE_78682_length_142_cov_22.976744_1_plen_37_part_01